MGLGRSRLALAFIALFLVAWLSIGNTQATNDLAALSRQVNRLYGQGKYAEAIPIAERYVALVRGKYGENHLEYATAILWLALVKEEQDRYAEAEPLYNRSLAIREKALGPEHPDVVHLPMARPHYRCRLLSFPGQSHRRP